MTRRILEVLAEHPGLSIVIITKSPLIAREVELLKRIARHASYSHGRNVGVRYPAGLAEHFDTLRAKYGIGDGSRY
ncbi:MAG: hypothetical protein ABI229_07170 [Gemmatimonadaceae bacterium]